LLHRPFFAAPALVVILRHERHPTRGPLAGGSEAAQAEPRRQWTRCDVLRHPLFYGVLTAVLAPPFVITAIFFYQVTLVQEKDWTLAWFSSASCSMPAWRCPRSFMRWRSTASPPRQRWLSFCRGWTGWRGTRGRLT